MRRRSPADGLRRGPDRGVSARRGRAGVPRPPPRALEEGVLAPRGRRRRAWRDGRQPPRARELDEETGLRAHVVDLGDDLGYDGVTVHVFAAEASAGWEPTLNDEHDDHRWCALGGRARAAPVRGAARDAPARGASPRGRGMRVGIDTSPLIQTRAGTARHVRGLVHALRGREGLELELLSFGGPGRLSSVVRDAAWYPFSPRAPRPRPRRPPLHDLPRPGRREGPDGDHGPRPRDPALPGRLPSLASPLRHLRPPAGAPLGGRDRRAVRVHEGRGRRSGGHPARAHPRRPERRRPRLHGCRKHKLQLVTRGSPARRNRLCKPRQIP